MSDIDDGDWLARGLDTLRAGWRGRLRLSAPDESHTRTDEEIIGTVVDEACAECDPDSDDIADAIVTVCANYRGGNFVALADCPRVAVRLSRVVAIQAM